MDGDHEDLAAGTGSAARLCLVASSQLSPVLVRAVDLAHRHRHANDRAGLAGAGIDAQRAAAWAGWRAAIFTGAVLHNLWGRLCGSLAQTAHLARYPIGFYDTGVAALAFGSDRRRPALADLCAGNAAGADILPGSAGALGLYR